MFGIITRAITVVIVIALIFAGGKFLQGKLQQEPPKELPPRPEVSITFQEGLNLDQIATKIEEGTNISAEEFILAAGADDFKTDYDFLNSAPKGSTLEGYLFPDTYRFFKDTTGQEILDKILANTEKKIQEVGWTDFTGPLCPKGYTPDSFSAASQNGCFSFHEFLTLASIIELETGGGTQNNTALAEERRTVAGIFYNRLQIGQALQSDATVNFVTKAGKASPTIEQTKVNSPYNTYQNPGLPPGPIGAPGKISLQAVLNPIKSNYFYFLHIQPNGEAVYSRNFDEHIANKNKYLK